MRQILLSTLFFVSLLGLVGCDVSTTNGNQIAQIQERGQLRVGTLYHPLYYFLRDGQQEGLDFELASQFADSLGVGLSMVPAYNLSELFALLDSGQVDMLAAGLANTPQRRQQYRFGPSYYHIDHTLVYRKGSKKPRNISQMEGTIAVLADSAQAQWLSTLELPELQSSALEPYELESSELELYDLEPQATGSQTTEPQATAKDVSLITAQPKLRWETRLDADEEDLLRQVAENKTDYTLVADILLARTQRYYPNIESAFTVGERQSVAWAWDRRMDDSAMAAMLDFFAEQTDSGNLARLHEKYFGHVQQFDYVDTRTFLSRIDSLLPRYQPLFERHAGELDWRLLAAISYQESHWDPNAVSYTGVRGMMMLTEDTAKQVGVSNRLDPEQSIRGGAQYLASLITRLPDAIPDSERIWFALASYNIGLGHVLDVRRLTEQLGQDPNAWSQVKANLPLLHQPKWYSQTRYGYARGRETKQFVNNIRQYYQSLLWQDNAQTDPSPQLESEPEARAELEATAKTRVETKAEQANLAASQNISPDLNAVQDLNKQLSSTHNSETPASAVPVTEPAPL